MTARASSRRSRSGAGASTRPPLPAPSRARGIAIAGVIAVLTFMTYETARHFDFVSLDDPVYVSDNPHVAAGLTASGVAWAFTTGTAGNWHPITWLSHMLDVQVFGMNPGAHHSVSITLHILNALLLFSLLVRLTGAIGRSGLVAGLFALHPLHVESVAWIAERKDLLATLFGLLTIWAYVGYVRHGRTARRFAVVLLLYAVSLMSKPMLVTLPLLLLVLDAWPLGRLVTATRASALVVEKLPLFVMAAASSVVTFVVQDRGGAVGAFDAFPLSLRLGNAVTSYAAYLAKMVWPSNLAALYPFPRSIDTGHIASALAILAAISYLAWRIGRRYPYLRAGWLWYVISLIPVSGLVQVGVQGMADRYTYLPLVGLFIAAVWAAADLLARWHVGRPAAYAASSAVLLACHVQARHQVNIWADTRAMWTHTLAVTTNNDRAHNAVGALLGNDGRRMEAESHFLEAVRIDPNFAEAHHNLGLSLMTAGNLDEAVGHLRTAVRLKSDYPDAHNNLGLALSKQGKVEEAIAHYTEALRQRPAMPEAHGNLGAAYARQGKMADAMAEYTEALRLNPALVGARLNLGLALASVGRTDEAVRAFTEVLRLDPTNAVAKRALDAVLTRGKAPAA